MGEFDWNTIKSEEAYARYRDELMSRLLYSSQWMTDYPCVWKGLNDEREPYVEPKRPTPAHVHGRLEWPRIAK